MGRHHHLPAGPDVAARNLPGSRRDVCHDRPMAVRAAPAVPERQSRRARPARRMTLFRRLFLTYVAVAGLAVAVLVLAPIRVSVPTALAELAVILAGFAVTLVLFHAFLRRALAPLQTLTDVMHEIDPLAPGQRIDATTGDEEVVALAEAFNEMLDRLEGERRDSGRRALAAQEAERRRIARELHDEIGQLLTGLILRGETLARRAPEELREDIVGLREGAREAAEEVRLIARRLRPEALDELGLQSALLALCTTVAERAGLEVERRLARDLPLTAEEELVIYRVAQESLTNVVRHAQARRVTVTLEPDLDRGVVLTVRDDGVGLPAEVADDSSGIRGMRERALLVGAQLSVSALEPNGTEVALRVPIKDTR
jgi:two-component system, NarL family, sensor histidine kinase UhpB